MRPAVTHQAPGKLFIAGEYAVLEPGQPGIVVAVDRYVTVTVSPASDADVVFATDLLPHDVRLRQEGTRLRPVSPRDGVHLDGPLAYVRSAVETVERLRAELGLPAAVPVRVEACSALHEQGVKIGLGSSGAVTVAAVSALTEFFGMSLSREMRFRLALLAAVRVDPGPSGADLAASAWGGWIAYRAPNRAALLDMSRRGGTAETLLAPWPGLAIRSLRPPNGLALHIGWSGSPISTTARIGSLARTSWWSSAARDVFLTRSARNVAAATHALEQDQPQSLLTTVRSARRLLARLDRETELGIYTPALTALGEAAEALGGAGKPSGAGGGDCGIAMLPAASPQGGELRTRWAAAGITPLDLRVTRAFTTAQDSSPDAGPVPVSGLFPASLSASSPFSDRGRST